MVATAVSDHGGLNDDDLHLGLIISNPLLKPGVVTDKVSQTQVCAHLRNCRAPPSALACCWLYLSCCAVGIPDTQGSMRSDNMSCFAQLGLAALAHEGVAL